MRWLPLAALLASCAPEPIVWDAPETAEFRRHDYECRRDAMYVPAPVHVPDNRPITAGVAKGLNSRGQRLDRDLYIECMESLGYNLRVEK